jgi:hypothetical protein
MIEVPKHDFFRNPEMWLNSGLDCGVENMAVLHLLNCNENDNDNDLYYTYAIINSKVGRVLKYSSI